MSNDMLQHIIVGLIVAAAAGYLLRRYLPRRGGKGRKGGNSACGSCGGCKGGGCH
ncbi:FeoB-associated Cys-rich membrane protein [Vogesella sp. LIG4]|uniref:FeoB-associated Cys-rich membrane protein n=1 Tax=Vogesella sp. LIG4 TaxID=1192162 RepID=UPI0008200F9B|nr:FeoB-associated Cys-rich membrane protein [Vogesella sp. LIG4]SCK22352.1 Multisubunit Na+/H+ antiporter, MnhE subunit [Vogesella sp. LIG4]